MKIANLFAKFFFYGIVLFVIVGILLPALFSAASTIAVILGFVLAFLTIYFGIVIAQYEVNKLIKKTSVEVKE